MSKTHWKKAVSDPNFLGEADFDENEEKVATISHVAESVEVQTAEGKSHKAVVYFREQLKPMILNVARSKAITKVAGSPYFEDWCGIQIQLYIDNNIKAFGEIVSAVRVRPRKPTVKRTPVENCADCGNPVKGAMGKSAEYIVAYTKKQFEGTCLCFDCAMKRKAVKTDEPSEANG